jgi:hypothetical protein
MYIDARIVCDSIGQEGIRLTTFQIHVPKFLLAEINTHRQCSRSYNSSRAIPAKKIRAQVQSEPFEPILWGVNQPGMKAEKYLTGFRLKLAIAIWRSSARSAAMHHWLLEKLGLHKQHTNRIVEPYMWADGVISASNWENLFALRCHPDAQPEFQELANIMAWQLKMNEPDYLKIGEWHLPYVTESEKQVLPIETQKLLGASRCARVSYGLPEAFNTEADLKRAKMLLDSEPRHIAPFEMVAQCQSSAEPSGNFKGWRQFRKELESASAS